MRVIANLLATTRQQHSILVGVFDGSISIPQTAPLATGPPVGGPYVSQAIFDSHLADRAYELSILSQGISGGGITVDDRLFKVLQDSTDFSCVIFLLVLIITNVLLRLLGAFKR